MKEFSDSLYVEGRGRRLIVLSFAFLVSFAGLTAAWAATPKELKKLNSEAADIDKIGNKPGGGAVVTGRLENEFSVTDVQITTLQDKKLGYGEIAIVFSLAQKMGGINDTNIDKLLSMRQGPPVMGWGELSKKLGFNLGTVVSDVKKVDAGSHRELTKLDAKNEQGGTKRAERMKEERYEGAVGAEHAAGHGHQ